MGCSPSRSDNIKEDNESIGTGDNIEKAPINISVGKSEKSDQEIESDGTGNIKHIDPYDNSLYKTDVEESLNKLNNEGEERKESSGDSTESAMAPPKQLPRLDTPPSHEILKKNSPTDLRGARYAKLPSSGEKHRTQKPTSAEERLRKELVDLDITSIETEAALKEIIEEDLCPGVSDEQVSTMCWALLYEEARDINPGELEEMKKREQELKMEEEEMKKLYNYILEGTVYIEDLKQEKVLSQTPWDVLIYNYALKLNTDSLTLNLALNLLQEKVVRDTVFAEILSVGLMNAAEDDMETLDYLEKLVNPPRRG